MCIHIPDKYKLRRLKLLSSLEIYLSSIIDGNIEQSSRAIESYKQLTLFIEQLEHLEVLKFLLEDK